MSRHTGYASLPLHGGKDGIAVSGGPDHLRSDDRDSGKGNQPIGDRPAGKGAGVQTSGVVRPPASGFSTVAMNR